VFPKTKVQFCIVHQIRNSLKSVTSEDSKPFLADLKKVYKAVSLESAEYNLLDMGKVVLAGHSAGGHLAL
jgi:transposase-like protein